MSRIWCNMVKKKGCRRVEDIYTEKDICCEKIDILCADYAAHELKTQNVSKEFKDISCKLWELRVDARKAVSMQELRPINDFLEYARKFLKENNL